jgi:hypothetical protein
MAGEQLTSPNPIAALNDEFRRTTREIMMTQGVRALPDMFGLIRAVRSIRLPRTTTPTASMT